MDFGAKLTWKTFSVARRGKMIDTTAQTCSFHDANATITSKMCQRRETGFGEATALYDDLKAFASGLIKEAHLLE